MATRASRARSGQDAQALGELATLLAETPASAVLLDRALRLLADHGNLVALVLARPITPAPADSTTDGVDVAVEAQFGVDASLVGRRIRLDPANPALSAWRRGEPVLVERDEAPLPLAGQTPMSEADGGWSGDGGAMAVLPVGQVGGALLFAVSAGEIAPTALAWLRAAGSVIALAQHAWQADDAAARQDATVGGVLDAVSVGVAIVAADATIARANAMLDHLAHGAAVSAAAPTPPTAGGLTGHPCRVALGYVDEAGRPLCDWACPRTRGDAGAVGGVIRAFVGQAGDRRAVDWSCVAQRDARGRIVGWTEVVEEVGRRHEVDDMRAALVSAVSHELLTPITIIKGHAESLRAPAARRDRALAEAALTAIDEETDRLRRLVANLLDLARIQTGALRLQLAPLALPALAERIVARFRGRSRRHAFSVHFPAAFPLVLADRDRLESVLYNLLDNAIKYSPRGGEVLISGTVEGERIVVSVTDRGIGIPWAEQGRVFERYYRVASAGGTRAEGSGLGLYIVRAIVEAHGGQVWVESRPGRGATFSFSLPREAPAELPVLAFGQR